jgi:PD-(D/E)XK nuclease family transposase
MSKYINPYTDFGFKKLFGEEGNKELLIDFLNELLPAHHQIADLTFQNVELLPDLDYIGIQQITATAEEEGFEKGREQERIEMVIKLWKKNKTKTEISDLLDIPLEIVTQIIEKHDE